MKDHSNQDSSSTTLPFVIYHCSWSLVSSGLFTSIISKPFIMVDLAVEPHLLICALAYLGEKSLFMYGKMNISTSAFNGVHSYPQLGEHHESSHEL